MKGILQTASAAMFLFLSMQAAGLNAVKLQASQLIIQQSPVNQCAYCALKRNNFGRSRLAPRKEQAFWVLDTPQGLQCDFWDDGFATANSASTVGLPGDAVALFHTHPANSAVFNDNDRSQAIRLEVAYGQGVEFIVLAGTKFGVFDPTLDTDAPVEAWFNNSLWLDELDKTDRQYDG